MPNRIAPQLVRPTPTPPAGDCWVHEIKHDGHRVVAYLERGRVRLKTRAGNDATARFAPITDLLAKLPVRSAVLDGETAVPDAPGVTNLDLLDRALLGRGGPLAITPLICSIATAGICAAARFRPCVEEPRRTDLSPRFSPGAGCAARSSRCGRVARSQ